MRKFIIIKEENRELSDVNELLQSFSNSLGLFNDRDKERSCFRIFVELIKAEKDRVRLSSDEIAEHSNLSRATVIHHIERLENSGLIKIRRNRYFLAKNSLEEMIDILEKDVLSTIKDLKKKARLLDKEIGLR